LEIRIAETELELRDCFSAFHELRPHLSEDGFVSQVQRQRQSAGYRVVYITEYGKVVAAAGYRTAEFLAWGRVFYVDDLITISSARQKGFGGKLMDWLMHKGAELDCDEFHLDSGVNRNDAHRLYMGHKMRISSYHFSKELRKSIE
jgi:hypothetical protein